jgi:hypothetical protein
MAPTLSSLGRPTAQAEIVADGRTIEIARVRITEVGQWALEQ